MDEPAAQLEFRDVGKIAELVASNFFFPECRVRFWPAKLWAFLMTVPEAAVDEDHGVVLGKDHIGASRQSRHVDAVAETVGPKPAPERQLRLSRRRPHASMNGFLGASRLFCAWRAPLSLTTQNGSPGWSQRGSCNRAFFCAVRSAARFVTKWDAMDLAMASTTGTTTELPKHL